MKNLFRTYLTTDVFRNNLPKFIKTGLAVIATLLLTAIIADKVTGGDLSAAFSNNAVFVNATSLFQEKELPIYCVKTDKKQIALTFDGAWGDGRYGHTKLSLYSHGFRGSVSEDKTFNSKRIIINRLQLTSGIIITGVFS